MTKKLCLTIRFTNDSSKQQLFPSFGEALRHAQDNVSYSSGKVAKVYVSDEYDQDLTLWSKDWDDASKATLWKGRI